jgi:hypothetical protein
VEREIDRDARVITSGFVHEVIGAALSYLQQTSLAARCPAPMDLFDRFDAITRKFRNLHRRLNDERINRRGDRADVVGAEKLPIAVRAFAHHGEYLGAFPTFEEFAHACLDPGRPEEWAGYVDLTHAGLDLHISGRYWTVDADGMTHAFAVGSRGGPGGPTPGGTAAREWRWSQTPVKRRARDEDWMDLLASGPPPPLPKRAPERARRLLQASGCDEHVITDMMPRYAGCYVQPGDHAWYHLRRGGVPGWVLHRVKFAEVADDWSRVGALTWADDPEGGAHVFAIGDPLASHIR